MKPRIDEFIPLYLLYAAFQLLSRKSADVNAEGVHLLRKLVSNFDASEERQWDGVMWTLYKNDHLPSSGVVWSSPGIAGTTEIVVHCPRSIEVAKIATTKVEHQRRMDRLADNYLLSASKGR